jgi:hypothetical protein
MVVRSSHNVLNEICTYDQKHHAVIEPLNLVAHLDCDAMKSHRWLPNFWRNVDNYDSTWHQNP